MNGIKYLLDTNTVIGLLNGYAPAIALAKDCGLSLDEAAFSSITRIELLGYPDLTKQEESAIQAFLGTCHRFPVDKQVDDEAIRLRRADPIKLPDAIICATAIVHRLRLITLDKDMQRKMNKIE